MRFSLSKYIIPSVISMVLVGTYTNIDGLFIGNVTGDPGLAAINIVWPIVALITALGTGIGLGGSVVISNTRGKGDGASADSIKSATIVLLIAVGLISSLVFKLFNRYLLIAMGAEGQVLEYAVAYADVISLGAIFQILGSGLIVLLRTEGKTYYSMTLCAIGLAVHILLDWLLVEKHTLSGVAMSTVVSQAVITVLAFIAIYNRRPAPIKRNAIKPILAASTSPIGINFVPSVVLLLTNIFALKAGGTAAVSAYAVMSYAVYTFDYVFQGVCDGVQPIISYSIGAEDWAQKRRVMKVSAIICAVCALVFAASTPLLIMVMPKLFAVSETARQMMATGFVFYAFSYPFKACVKYLCSYYYAAGHTKLSNLLVYVDPLIFTPILLAALSAILNLNGVWLSLLISQALLSALGLVISALMHRKAARAFD